MRTCSQQTNITYCIAGYFPQMQIFPNFMNELTTQEIYSGLLYKIQLWVTIVTLRSTSQPTRVKITTNRIIYAWQLKYAIVMPTVLCMSNGLICDYIPFTSAYGKKRHHITHHVKFAAIHQTFLSSNLLVFL